MRRVIAFKGPLTIGRLARVVLAPHRDTVIGRPVYDLGLLVAEPPAPPAIVAGAGSWPEFLRAPERGGVESALAWLVADRQASPDDPRESRLRIVDAHLAWLERRFPRSAAEDDGPVVDRLRTLVASLHVDRPPDELARSDPASFAAACRRVIVGLPPGGTSPHDRTDGARAEARRLAREAVDYGIRAFLRAREEALREIEYDLEAALSEALSGEKTMLRPGLSASAGS
jgi:hypothetical protein